MTTTAALQVGLESEIGPLREVIVHRPGTELERLTPANALDLLFDDVMWPERARNEHDGFAEVLREHGARVHLFAELLAEALDTPGGREFAVAEICTDDRFGPSLAKDLRFLFADTDAPALADMLIGGVVKSDPRPAPPAPRRHPLGGWVKARPHPPTPRQQGVAGPRHRRLPAPAVAEHPVPT